MGIVAQKTFIDIPTADIKLVSDDRDMMLPLAVRKQVEAWCASNEITAEPVGDRVFIQTMFGVTLWRVKDEAQRVAFALRWA